MKGKIKPPSNIRPGDTLILLTETGAYYKTVDPPPEKGRKRKRSRWKKVKQ